MKNAKVVGKGRKGKVTEGGKREDREKRRGPQRVGSHPHVRNPEK